MRRNNIPSTSPVFVNLDACDGCGLCVDVCPKGLFEMKELSDEEHGQLSFVGKIKVRIKGRTKSYVTQPDDCISCGKCVRSCHERAITVRDMKKRA